MKCVICKHGTTKAGRATITMERGGTTVVIKGVPAEVCANCEEGMWPRRPRHDCCAW